MNKRGEKITSIGGQKRRVREATGREEAGALLYGENTLTLI